MICSWTLFVSRPLESHHRTFKVNGIQNVVQKVLEMFVLDLFVLMAILYNVKQLAPMQARLLQTVKNSKS